MWQTKREISRECNDIIGSAKGLQISEKYRSEVVKGKRADIYLEVRKRRGPYIFSMKQVPVGLWLTLGKIRVKVVELWLALDRVSVKVVGLWLALGKVSVKAVGSWLTLGKISVKVVGL